MLNVFQAAILGLVQGLTEFLPISSSAHLVLLPWLFKFPDPGLAFDVLLHLATGFALLLYFWKDLLQILKGFWQSIIERKLDTIEKKLGWLIIFASLPAALLGYLYEDTIERTFRDPQQIALLLIVFSILLFFAERMGKKQDPLKKLSWYQALFIGFAQAFALMPGVSRAGITMTAGLFCGLKREASARFSFLLATPLVLGTGLIKAKDLFLAPSGYDHSYLWVGFITALLAGILAIRFLLNYLPKHSFYIFVWYRLALGLILLLLFLI